MPVINAFTAGFIQLGSVHLRVPTTLLVGKNAVRKPYSKSVLFQSEKDDDSSSEIKLSRREIFVLAVGGAAYAKVVSSAISKLKRGDAYPEEHEMRVANIFRHSIIEASSSISDSNRPLRILEVGVGDKCRTIMRGMYDDALKDVSESKSRISGVEIIGVDIDAPSDDVVESARKKLGSISASLPVTFNAMQADVEKRLNFPDKYFDVITCSLVLCSVSDQERVLREIKRLLNSGGCYGWVEHVAVDLENENNQSFFELQQRVLDPLQQAVAHNCHLHRRTDQTCGLYPANAAVFLK
eukprot:scaffold485_cov241-Chaetoceros_neogracile.AAC.6